MEQVNDPHRFHLYNNYKVSGKDQWCIISQQVGNVLLCVGGEIVHTGDTQRAMQQWGTKGAYYFLCKEDAQAELGKYLSGLCEEAGKVYVNI